MRSPQVPGRFVYSPSIRHPLGCLLCIPPKTETSTMYPRRIYVLTLVAVFLVGCGSDEADLSDTGATTEEVEASDAATSAPQVPGESTRDPLTIDDIDRWQQGMEAELDAVQQAEEDLRDASTSDDTLNAMMASNDMSTRAAGARAAGVSEDRYEFIRTTFSSAVKNLTPISMEMDVSQMPSEMVQQFEQSRQASLDRMSDVLPDDVVEVLRDRAEELRRQDVELTGARLRAAGVHG